MSRKILWSHPITAPDDLALPSGFELIWRERELSAAFARKYSRLGNISEYLLRFYVALTILKRRRKFDAIVTGRYGELFALFQGLWPFGRRPLVLLDVEWYSSHGSGWRAALSRWLHHRMSKGAARIQVFCRVEAGNYARRFNVPEERFVWIPYCTSLPDGTGQDSVREETERSFAFSGGLHHRDYKTLFSAIEDLPLELHVAAPREAVENLAVPSNVRLLGVIPPADYWRELRASQMVILSLEPNHTRCPGVITYVAAMARGKCVVVNEPAGSPDYIDDGHTGFIVPSSDPAALRALVAALLADPERMRAVGERAGIAAARRFSAAAYYEAVQLVTSAVGSPERGS
ncbi:MAG: glycosyltransferase [Bryobacteraceae bacterium]|jgi:glycosyltransferase involved in cell wall biosynthesis